MARLAHGLGGKSGAVPHQPAQGLPPTLFSGAVLLPQFIFSTASIKVLEHTLPAAATRAVVDMPMNISHMSFMPQHF